MNLMKLATRTILTAVIAVLFVGSSAAVAQDVTLTMPTELKGKPGDTVLVAVKAANATGVKYPNFDFEFSFDATFIKFAEADVVKGAMLPSSGLFAVGAEYETIKVAYASTDSISGTGTLFTLKGVLQTVNSDSLAGDSTNYIPPSDSSTTVPGTYNATGVQLVDVFLGNGTLTVSPATPASIPVTVSSTVLSLPSVSGAVGDVVEFPVSVTDLSAAGIVAYELEFEYDSTVVTFSNTVNTTGTISANGSVVVNNETMGTVKVAGAFADSLGAGTSLVKLNAILVKVAEGSPVTVKKAEFFNKSGESFSYVATAGAVTVTSGTGTSIENPDVIPSQVELKQNYPNPFNPSTQITFAIPQAGNVTLEVFNVVGQKVATLVNAPMSAGYHTVAFDATNLSSGMLIYRITAGNEVQVKQMMLIK